MNTSFELNLSASLNLPFEAYVNVIKHVNIPTLVAMRSLSRDWQRFISDHPYTHSHWHHLFQTLWKEPIPKHAPLNHSPYELFIHRFKLLGLHHLAQAFERLAVPNIVIQINTIRRVACTSFFNTLLIERKREQILDQFPLNPNFLNQDVASNLKVGGLSPQEEQDWLKAVTAYQTYHTLNYANGYYHRQANSFSVHYSNHPLHSMSMQRLEARYLSAEVILFRVSQKKETFKKDWIQNGNSLNNYMHAEMYLNHLRQSENVVFEEEAKKLLFSAAKTHHWEIVANLIAYIDCSAKDEDGMNALQYLSNLSIAQDPNNYIRSTLKALIDQGCPILGSDDPNDIKSSPLMLATEHCNLEMLEFFLDNIEDEDIKEALNQIGLGLDEDNTDYEYDDEKLEVLQLIANKNIYPALGSDLFLEMLNKSNWHFLSYLSSKTQLQQTLFHNIFHYIEYDIMLTFDASSKLDCFTNILPRIEEFFDQVNPQINLDATHHGTTTLHQCIDFFENELIEVISWQEKMIEEIETIKESDPNELMARLKAKNYKETDPVKLKAFHKKSYEDANSDLDEVIVLLKNSYLTCVKSLTTQTNHELADSNGCTPINLIKDINSPVYQYLVEQQQRPKKRLRVG